jgi:alkyl hydroperoxide reductase subunit AhpC
MTLALSLFLAVAHADNAAIGAPAPDFTLTDTDGKSVTLSEQKGSTVVLEWFNPGCPFVKYAHGSGPLKNLASTWSSKDVRWFAVNSGAPGKEGAGLETNKQAKAAWSMSYPVLLDESGKVGHEYGATSTPTIVVIDSAGVVRYKGALDDAPMGQGGVGRAYANDAIAAVTKGDKVGVASTKSYGCSVKY